MNSKVATLVVILLVIASFLAGTLWSKVGYFEKNLAKTSPSPSPLQPAQLPVQPQVLEAQEIANLAKNGMVLGSSETKVTVVEFSDPSCPYCAAAQGVDLVVGKDKDGKEIHIISDYLKSRNSDWEAPVPKLEDLAREGKIKLVFRYYPGHGTAEQAMQAAWCVGEQKKDKFWEFLNLAFANQDKLDKIEEVLKLATQIGQDKETIKACVESGKYKARIQDDIQAARSTAKQLTGSENFGTPTFFVNGRQIVGAQSWQVFAKIIEEEMKK